MVFADVFEQLRRHEDLTSAQAADVMGTIMDGQVQIQAGAGIVADSVPAAEYEETRDKARALIQALERANEGLR